MSAGGRSSWIPGVAAVLLAALPANRGKLTIPVRTAFTSPGGEPITTETKIKLTKRVQ